MKKPIIVTIFFLCTICCTIQAQETSPQSSNLSAGKLKRLGYHAMKYHDAYSAIDFFEAYSAKRKNIKVLYSLAECYRAARDYKSAREAYSEVYEAKPKAYPLALYYQAALLKTEKRYEEARILFQKFKKSGATIINGIDYKKLTNLQIQACDSALQWIAQPKNADIVHANNDINKASIEFSPLYLTDSTLLFAALRSDTIVYTVVDRDMHEIPQRKFYTATLAADNTWNFSNEWNDARHLTAPNEQIGNGAFSLDKRRFYFTRCVKNNSFDYECALYVSEKMGQTWGKPDKLPHSINAKGVHTTQPTIGINSKTNNEVLYFVSNRHGGKGGMDIWFSEYQKNKGEWTTPKNCGNAINTPGDELTPFFDITNRTLYFSSNGLAGLGELDIFKATGELGKWIAVENVGAPVNSPFDDLYYVPHPNHTDGVFTSNRTGSITTMHENCCDDLYFFRYNNHITLATEGLVLQKINPQVKHILGLEAEIATELSTDTLTPAENIPVTLYMIDEQTKEKVVAAQQHTDKNGYYLFNVEKNTYYEIEVEGQRKPNPTLTFNTKNSEQSDTLQQPDVVIEYIPQIPFIIKNIYYDFDKSDLRNASKTVLDTTVLVILNENPHIVVEISSHTDSKGDYDYNIKLSQRRAESVVNYLIKSGIDKNRLVARGYGETRPIAPNENEDGSDNPEGRQKNRRTEFKIIGTIDSYEKIIYEE
ncbi:MAG: OmpA family protein [Bacteroidales bacterium]|jgi:outer membrane protein OmpA-like peptidoglycan-associated protein/tetratricopeptide (TPR) repeat protein|nr:OmpA family protein [Bacteroidales bacterium]